MRAVVAQLSRIAGSDANVLITGETGAGKDAVAVALHRLGARARQPFITVDCPGLPPSLLEAELFGHERGAFTDAATAKPGRFELAGRGTLYLDRVDELSIELQAKLLRLVEHKQVERLGGRVSIPIEARILASADERIESAVSDGAFRSDLYHRLRVLPVRVPPLRDRRQDLLPLARRFIRAAASEASRAAPTLTADAAARLTAHSWPGNVRELRHLLTRAVLSTHGPTLAAVDLAIEASPDPDVLFGSSGDAGRPTLDDLERRYIALILEEVRGSQVRAASILGISRKALWEKRKRYGLA
jgi:DNA-binding NtrC family response regulator